MNESSTDVFSFVSPVLFLVTLPYLILLLLELYNRSNRRTVAMTGLEYLRLHNCMAGKNWHHLRLLLWAVLVLLLGLLWAAPILHTTSPVFAGGDQPMQKNLMVAIDISRSMSQPLKVADKEARFANYGGNEQAEQAAVDQVTRYESARQTFYNLVDRFEGANIGLILFSTEPFLARWPTVETEDHFIEVLEENIGRSERSQLQRLSSLTNIDKAISLTRDVFASQQHVRGGAVVLISDAEDELEKMGMAIRSLREQGIRLYTIGVGISEIIVEKLTDEFADDPGFRIFHVDSAQEMEEAYRLVSELEESPGLADQQQEYVTQLRWIIAMVLVMLGVIVIWLSETRMHQSLITDQSGQGGTRKQ
jgi:hypothetical protein